MDAPENTTKAPVDELPLIYLSARAHIAATVLAGIAAHPGSHQKVSKPGVPCDTITDNVEVAVLYADKLLEALRKP